jgi:hypothetical protein
MYVSSEDQSRQAFKALKEAMGADAERAVHCLEKDLDSLVIHYRFERKFWIALKTTNPIERINKEFKKRSRSMGTLGERTLECLLHGRELTVMIAGLAEMVSAAPCSNSLPELDHRPAGNAHSSSRHERSAVVASPAAMLLAQLPRCWDRVKSGRGGSSRISDRTD